MASNLNVATYEQILTILTQLATNYTNIFDLYYRMFYSDVPEDLAIQLYDDEGNLNNVAVPNRAKDRMYILNGNGDPNGVTSGSKGSIYQDLTNGSIYMNIDGTVNGWSEVISVSKLQEIVIQGEGSPEGAVTASVGTLYSDTAIGTLYIKTTSTGNRGWVNVSADVEDMANPDLSNLTMAGESHFANPFLNNLNETGEAHFANPQLSNLDLDGEAHFANPDLSNLSQAGVDVLAAKEDKSNKVNAINSASTQAQYPSAYAVYNLGVTKEDIANKVTTVNAYSTNSQYPSAAAVYNAANVAKDNAVTIAAPVGAIMYCAKGAVPTGWLVCDGSSPRRADYPELFAAIGTTYGVGDGSTTFGLPNLINKFPQGNTTVGTQIAAGLPNITGSWRPTYGWLKGATYAGAFTAYAADTGSGSGSTANVNYGINFNASRSSAIYGNSTTVQPPALTLLPIIKY